MENFTCVCTSRFERFTKRLSCGVTNLRLLSCNYTVHHNSMLSTIPSSNSMASTYRWLYIITSGKWKFSVDLFLICKTNILRLYFFDELYFSDCIISNKNSNVCTVNKIGNSEIHVCIIDRWLEYNIVEIIRYNYILFEKNIFLIFSNFKYKKFKIFFGLYGV